MSNNWYMTSWFQNYYIIRINESVQLWRSLCYVLSYNNIIPLTNFVVPAYRSLQRCILTILFFRCYYTIRQWCCAFRNIFYCSIIGWLLFIRRNFCCFFQYSPIPKIIKMSWNENRCTIMIASYIKPNYHIIQHVLFALLLCRENLLRHSAWLIDERGGDW